MLSGHRHLDEVTERALDGQQTDAALPETEDVPVQSEGDADFEPPIIRGRE
jgi:hypothetical protein